MISRVISFGLALLCPGPVGLWHDWPGVIPCYCLVQTFHDHVDNRVPHDHPGAIDVRDLLVLFGDVRDTRCARDLGAHGALHIGMCGLGQLHTPETLVHGIEPSLYNLLVSVYPGVVDVVLDRCDIHLWTEILNVLGLHASVTGRCNNLVVDFPVWA